jgi:MOSC domain-containing protein YiiM
MGGRITGLQASDGGVPKRALASAQVTAAGLAGDRQRNLKHHGGPDRALCLLAQEIVDDLAAQGHPIRAGSTGENITIAGLPWVELVPGTRVRLGRDVVLEITSYTKPCFKIAGSFAGGEHGLLDQQRNPGRSRLYARVVAPGDLVVGDAVEVVPAR